MKKKKIRIMIELPANYFMDKSELDILSSFTGRFRDGFQNKLMEKAVEEAIKGVKLPPIKIDAKEVKDRILQILAERALEKE